MTQTPAVSGPRFYFSAGLLIDQQFSAERRSPVGKSVGIAFGFDPAYPFAVTLTVTPVLGRPPLGVWTFAREMLDNGRVGPVGGAPGTVRIAPKARFIEFDLTDPETGHRYLLSVECVDIDGVLIAFDQIIPLAAEPYLRENAAALDVELRALLDQDGAR